MKQVSTIDYANARTFPVAKLARKGEVLAFMRSQTPFCATAGHFNDATTGMPVEGVGWGWYRSGGWQWSDRDAYHVERYDLELDPEFVAYALSCQDDAALSSPKQKLSMEMLGEEQEQLLVKLGLPTEFNGLSDDELIRIEDALSDELQSHGINATGDGLNEYGSLCLSCIEALPD